MRLTNLEREMTKKEKSKEKRLKKKYDDSEMKASMKKQYGDDWKNVYYATIRKKAMEKMQTERKSLSSLRNRSSFDAQNRIKDKNKLPTPKVVKPAQLDLFDAEAGDHDRMYKVVHAKKGMMDIKAKTSYEAAKKFAKEKGLKSTAGVDTHLYPLEEGKMSPEAELEMLKRNVKNPAQSDKAKEKMKARIKELEELKMLKRNANNPGQSDAAKKKMKARIKELVKEGAMSDLHARIMSSDDPHDAIYKMLTQDGPEEKYIQAMYNDTSAEYGLHPDDDFEDIIDRMVDEIEGDMPFEGYYKMPNIDKERYTEMPGLEGPFQTMSGKPVYYDPKEGSYYDRDTDMYLTYAEFKALDEPRPETGRMKEDGKDDEYKMHYRDPSKVKADVIKHLANMYNSAKKDGGYTSEKMRLELHDLLFDMDMAGYMNSDYYDIEGFFHKGIDVKANEKINMGMLKKAYAQAKNLDTDTSVDPEIFNIGGSAIKSHATEGHSPHKKGTEKYKKHMAAMHANSVDLNAMRDALKLDESTDANTVVAQYTRACLDLSHNTWGKVCEQIDHVRSFIKEDVDVKNVRLQIRKMHEQESLDRKIQIKENVDKLRQIVKDKSAMSIKFQDGSMKVDMTTASIFLQVFDKVKEETQAKIVDRIQTKAGFLSVLDKMYSMIG